MNTLSDTSVNTSSITMTFENEASEELVELLGNTVYGTPGGILYRHLGTGDKIRSHRNLTFLNVRRNNHVIATAGFCRRIVKDQDSEHLSYYIRYLCIHQNFRSSTGKKNPEIKKRSNNSFVSRILGMIDQFGKESESTVDKRFFYAFIEEANHRSRELSERMGYEIIRSYNTILFSCFFPRKNNSVSRINKDEKPVVRKMIREYYKNHSLYFEDHLFFDDNYYLLKKNGEIIAGVQANPAEWEFHEIPGISGFMMLKVFPWIPVLSRLFNKRMKFMAFESVFVKAGFEKELSTLFESVCAENKVNMGILWLDDKGEHYRKINALKNFGLLKKLKKGAPVNILVRFDGYSEEEKAVFKNKPVFLSAFDMT
jgi:hypothetical protein